MDWKCELNLWFFTWDWIMVIGLSKFGKVDFNPCHLDVFTILEKSNHVLLYFGAGLIILSFWGSGPSLHRIYKASSKDPSSFFSRAQSCCLQNWLDCGDLKVFATRRWAPKPWTEFNRVTYWTREKTSVTVLRWVLCSVKNKMLLVIMERKGVLFFFLIFQ